MLGRFKVEPAGVETFHAALKYGPGRRDFSNKMAYAPDRGSALYCGANHGSPHRLNDVWEFHLLSNTWRMLVAPGHDATVLRALLNTEQKLREALVTGRDPDKNRAELDKLGAQIRDWYRNVDVKNGYLEDTVNGGPVEPSHTWDGVTYDEATRRLYWAVLDSDNFAEERNRVQRERATRFAQWTGRDVAQTLARLRPGSSMYWFDPAKARWSRQLGDAPLPVMRGMGGTLVYLPDRNI
ncbi:MAG: hypothetical protein JNJ60_13125, partial [Rhodocyclaceae bacterium]|nr:hypothetical protein [Rhodocyclaceae bacterium]